MTTNNNNNNENILDQMSFEDVIEYKLDSFLEHKGESLPDSFYELLHNKLNKVLFNLLLEKRKYTKVKAAKMLGIDRNTIYNTQRRMERK